jgi:hypothetical protein
MPEPKSGSRISAGLALTPANGVCPTDCYVRLATGLDATSATPIRGMRHGIADEKLDVVVEVPQQISQRQYLPNGDDE